MNVIEYIQGEMASLRRSVERVMKEMDPVVFNWGPPGTANTISATFIHFINSEDHFIQTVLQGEPTVWEIGGWAQKTGIPKPPGIGEDWSDFKRRQVQIAPIFDYAAEVWSATDKYLSSLPVDDLNRMVNFHGSDRSVAYVLRLCVSQAQGHLGEIAALKGVQGKRGLPV